MDIKVLPVAVKVVDQSRECPVYRKLSFGARAIFFYQGELSRAARAKLPGALAHFYHSL